MFSSAYSSPLALAGQRGDELRFQAAQARLVSHLSTRRVLAASLRRAADHLDPAPFRRTAAAQW